MNLLEKVNEVVPFLCLSCLVHLECARNSKSTLAFVVQRMQSPLSQFSLAFYLSFLFAFPLLGAPVVGLSSSRFEMGIFDFLLKMSFGHQLESAIVDFLVADSRLLSVDCSTFVNSSDFSICMLYRVSNMWSVALSVTADNTLLHLCRCLERLSFCTSIFDKNFSGPRKLATIVEEVVDHPRNVSVIPSRIQLSLRPW